MSLRVPEVSLSVTKSPTTFCGIRVEDNMRVEASRFWKNHLRGSFYLEPSWHESERTSTTLIKRVEAFAAIVGFQNKVKWSKSWPGQGGQWRATRVWGRCWWRRGGRGGGGERTDPPSGWRPCLAPETRWNCKTIDKEADPTSTSSLLTKFFTSPTGILDFPFHLFLFTFSLSLAFPLHTLESSSQSQISF